MTTQSNATNTGTILDDYATAGETYVAGLVGFAGDSVTFGGEVSNTGDVTAKANDDSAYLDYVGGIAGYVTDTLTQAFTGTVGTGLSNKADIVGGEYVGGIAGSAVEGHVVVLDHNGVLVAAGHHDLTVHVVGAQHTDLGHAHDGAVSTGGGEEGVEKTVQLLGHDDQGVGSSAALVGAGREEGDRTQAHDQCQDHGKNSFAHFNIFLQ